MNEIRKFFGYSNLAEFRGDWTKLTASDKAQLRSGIESGTLTY